MKKDLIFASEIQSSATGFDEEKVKGLLRDALEKGDKLSLSDKNLKGDTEHVILIITPNGSDKPVMVLLSRGVSKTVRTAFANDVPKATIIKALTELRMITTLIADEERTVIINDSNPREEIDWASMIAKPAVSLGSLEKSIA
jgi:hypothetical protein